EDDDDSEAQGTWLTRIFGGTAKAEPSESGDPEYYIVEHIVDCDHPPTGYKAAALLLLDSARDAWGEDLPDEQEIVADIADIIVCAFVLESTWLRWKKISRTDAGREAGKVAWLAVELLCHLTQDLAAPKAEAVISHFRETAKGGKRNRRADKLSQHVSNTMLPLDSSR